MFDDTIPLTCGKYHRVMDNLGDHAAFLWSEGLGRTNRCNVVVRFLVRQLFRSTGLSVKYEVQHILPGKLHTLLEIDQFTIAKCHQGTSSCPRAPRRLWFCTCGKDDYFSAYAAIFIDFERLSCRAIPGRLENKEYRCGESNRLLPLFI